MLNLNNIGNCFSLSFPGYSLKMGIAVTSNLALSQPLEAAHFSSLSTALPPAFTINDRDTLEYILFNNSSMRMICERDQYKMARKPILRQLLRTQNPVVERAICLAEESDVWAEAHRLLAEFNEQKKGHKYRLTQNFSEFIRIDTVGKYDIHQLLCGELCVFRTGFAADLFRQRGNSAFIQNLAYRCYTLLRAIEMDSEIP